MSLAFVTSGGTPHDIRLDLGAGNTKGYPVALGIMLKYANHPTTVKALVNIGNSETSENNSIQVRTNVTDGGYAVNCRTAAGVNTLASATLSNPAALDGQWHGVFGIAKADDGTDARRIDVANGAATGTSSALGAITESLRYISIGKALDNGEVLGDGHKLAEFVVLFFEPTAQDITDYQSMISAGSIWSGSSDWYWYRFNESGVYTDASGNGGPTITVGGTRAFFDSDHPPIEDGFVSGELVTQPMQIGASLLADKTDIDWAVRAGHTGLAGDLLGEGAADGTTNSSGEFVFPDTNVFGEAGDPVTLFMYWTEGTDPVVDRSLIVKTTLTEPA